MFPVSPFLCSLSPFARRLYLPLRQNPSWNIKLSRLFFFFFFIQSTLSLSLSLLYLSLSFLTSFFSLLSLWFADEWVPLMIVLRRLWDADGCGLVIVVMDHGFDGCGLVVAMEASSSSSSSSFLVLRGSSWVRLGSDHARPTQNDMLSNLWFNFGSWFGFGILGLDLIYRCEGGCQAVPWKKMTTGREVVSVSCGFWFGVMGLLVAAMVEVSFLSFFFFLLWLVVVSGYGGCGWMWRCLSTVNFFSLFFC